MITASRIRALSIVALALFAAQWGQVWADQTATSAAQLLAEVRELRRSDPAAALDRLAQGYTELDAQQNAEALHAIALEWAALHDSRSDYAGGEVRMAELLASHGAQWQPAQRLQIELVMANFMRRQQRRDDALAVYARGLPVAQSLSADHPYLLGELYLGRGTVQHDRGEYDLAIADYLEALRQFERGDHSRNQVSALTRLGISALRARDLNSALEYFTRAETVLEQDPSAELAILIYPNLGIVYQELGRPEDAIAAYQQGHELAKQLNSTLVQAQSLLNIGTIYYSEGRYSEALDYYQQSLVTSEDANIQYGVLVNQMNIGQARSKLGQHAQARVHLEQARELAEAGDHKLELRKIYELLTELHTETGDYPQALNAQAQFIELNELLFNESRDRAIAELRVQYETDLQAEQLLVQEARLQQIQNRNRLLSVILLLGVGVIAFGVWQYFQRIKTLRLLYARNRDLVDLQFGPTPRREPAPQQADEQDQSELGEAETDEPHQLHDVYLRLRQTVAEQALYRDLRLTIIKLASAAGSNRNYVSSALSRYGSGNFSSFINGFRVNEARRVLSNPSPLLPMLDLIDQCGFSSRSAFYEAFKREVGMTPMQYRDLALEDQVNRQHDKKTA